MVFIKFTSRVDPTWNGTASHHNPRKGRGNVTNIRRKDFAPTEEVCKYMNLWGSATIRGNRRKLAKNQPNG